MNKKVISFLIAWLLPHIAYSGNREELAPPYVDSVAAMTIAKTSGCTAFLVEGDVMVTNAHCLLGKATGSGCSEIKFNFFDSKNYKAEEVACEQVIYSSFAKNFAFKKTDVLQDYAYLKIKKTTRPPLEISSEGAGDLEKLTVISMNFPKYKMEEKKCYAKQGTFIYPAFKQRESAVIQLNDCDIIGGNSGSPVINEKGKVVAIIADSINLERSGLLGNLEIRNLPKKKAALATNFACAGKPAKPESKGGADNCRVRTEKEKNQELQSFSEPKKREVFDQINRLMPEMVEKNAQAVVWGYVFQQTSQYWFFNVAPVCVDMTAVTQKTKAKQRITTFQIYAYTDSDFMYGFNYDAHAIEFEFDVSAGEQSASLVKYKVEAHNKNTGNVTKMNLFGCDKLKLIQECRLNPGKCKLYPQLVF